MQPGIDQLVDELQINGFVVFDDLIPVDTIDRIYARCKPMMDRVEAWNSTTLKGERSTGQGRVTQKQRFKIYPPFEMPFCDPVITEELELGGRDLQEICPSMDADLKECPNWVIPFVIS